MKQYLCLEDGPDQKAGNLYPDFHGIGPDLGVYAQATWRCDFVEVETFEQDGQTWIKHDGGECPVPDFWDVDIIIDGFTYSDMQANHWSWCCSEYGGNITAYRIISTGENEQTKVPSITEVAHRVPESITAVDPSPAPKPLEVSGMTIEQFLKSVQTLKDLTQIQCSDGNWNHDAYMHGMANGMLLALSLFEGGEPKYLDAPASWLEDAVIEEPDQVKVFPSSALRDMTDTIFSDRMGKWQFIGGGE